MSKLSLVSTPTQALRGVEHAVLIAPARQLQAGVWKRVFPEGGSAALLPSIVKELDAGPGGAALTTLVAGPRRPVRLSVIALPDTVSRHNAPSRSLAIEAQLRSVSPKGKVGIVLVLEEAEHWLPAANAVARVFPLFDRKTEGTSKKGAVRPTVSVAALDPAGAPLKPDAFVRGAVEATRWAASLVDRPTAELSAADFVTEVRRALRGRKGVRVRTIVGDELLRRGLGGVHGVGRAARVPPRLLVLEHRPRGAKRTVALVGKGVVYDTGGLNIKVGGGMFGMKCDMGGAAAVAGAFRALVGHSKKCGVVAVIPLAENAVGPDSYRPGDILTLHSGKTVEINNTDAEGRLLLADGVSYAATHFKPDLIVDAATLTGAQLIATGKRHAAIVSNRGNLEAASVAAGRRTGDLVHPLPFAPELFQSEFASAVADMCNSVKDRMNAQTSCAGQFVYSHLGGDATPWLHVDLAGPAFPEKRGTGFGVGLLAELVRSLKGSQLKK